MSEDETATASIEKKLDSIETAVRQINERALKTETSMSYIKWIAIIGFSASIGAATFLDQKQSDRINRVEARLEAKIDGVEERLNAKIDRIEASFASQRNTTCQCDETKANDE